MKNIYKKLLDIQKLGLTFTKNAENPFFKSKYLDLDDLNKGLMPTLNEKGLLLLHRTRKKAVVTEIVEVETGEKIESSFPIPDSIVDPQKMGSAITYAKRYNIGQLFNIITDKDDDGNATNSPTLSTIPKRGYRLKDGKLYKMENNPKIKVEPKLPTIREDGNPF